MQITGINICCPFCGTVNEFAGPPVVRSRRCSNPDCNLYVCELEWKRSFLEEIDKLITATTGREQTPWGIAE